MCVLVWTLIKCAFDLRCCPTNLNDYLGGWLKTFKKPEKKIVLVGSSTIFPALWKRRNDIIFRSKKIYDPMTFIRLMCNWIVHWSVLQRKKPEQKLLQLGAKLIERVASEIYKVAQGWRLGVRRLGG